MCHKAFLQTVVVLSCLLPAAADAGAIFLPGTLAEGKFVANQDAKGPLYSIQYSAVTAAVDNRATRVKIEQTIVGPERAGDAVCLRIEGILEPREGRRGRLVQVQVARKQPAREQVVGGVPWRGVVAVRDSHSPKEDVRGDDENEGG